METIDHRLIELALERANSENFEKFTQAFFSATFGAQFVPLGGMHDGGADGWLDSSLFSLTPRETYLQASITENPDLKIRKTVERLREFGRNPKQIIYCTNRNAGTIDTIETDLSEVLNCIIKVRDKNFFVGQINNSPLTIQAYNSFLAPALSFLGHTGSGGRILESAELPTKTLCVFIGQELERRLGQSALLETITDSLIIWALEGTDPETKKFLSASDIEHKVIGAMPSAKAFFRGVMQQRLDVLSSKSTYGRKINFHSKEDGYCLPYETRRLIADENLEDETLRLEVNKIFESRISQQLVDKTNLQLTDEILQVCHTAIHKAYYRQGLELSLFFSREETEEDPPSIESNVEEAIFERGLKGDEAALIAHTAMGCLRGAFYKSTPLEREYFGKLSRTYVLLFLLKNEPRIVEHLRNMSGKFILYVGADILVRALSEQLLPESDRMTANALKALKTAGSKLILTDKAVDEVWHHLKNSDLEFHLQFQELAPFMTFDLAQQIRKILIRSYFYYRIEVSQAGQIPLSWERYLGKFLTTSKINTRAGRDELREYLVGAFGMEFENDTDFADGVDSEELESLSEKILKAREKHGREVEAEKTLCRNAAATILRVYSRRRQNNERPGASPFGFSTWWLTQQTKVRRATGEIVAKNTSLYMMRPEFILHFLAAMPTEIAVRNSYLKIFPSLIGIRLGNRMDEAAFRDVITRAREVFDETDDARARVILSNATAQLQADFFKRYDY